MKKNASTLWGKFKVQDGFYLLNNNPKQLVIVKYNSDLCKIPIYGEAAMLPPNSQSKLTT